MGSFRNAMETMLAMVLALLASGSCEVVDVSPETAVWVIHPDDTGPSARAPVALALRDAKRDWYKVFGAPPALIVSDAEGAAALPVDFGGTAFFLGAAAAPFGADLAGEEEHAIVLREGRRHPPSERRSGTRRQEISSP